jgi:adenosylcobyric acid synthase
MRKVSIIDLPFRGREEFGRLFQCLSLDVHRVRPQEMKPADIIVLGGSKRTIDDLIYLRQNGGEQMLRSHLARGGKILAVCGGFQMLGHYLFDPNLKQGDVPVAKGFSLLPHNTYFGARMLECKTKATLLVGRGAHGIVRGEEHRSGFSFSHQPHLAEPLLKIERRVALAPCPDPDIMTPGAETLDGAVTLDRQIWATYVHLICENEAFLHSFLAE